MLVLCVVVGGVLFVVMFVRVWFGVCGFCMLCCSLCVLSCLFSEGTPIRRP